jgi:hypothetical protein
MIVSNSPDENRAGSEKAAKSARNQKLHLWLKFTRSKVPALSAPRLFDGRNSESLNSGAIARSLSQCAIHCDKSDMKSCYGSRFWDNRPSPASARNRRARPSGAGNRVEIERL